MREDRTHGSIGAGGRDGNNETGEKTSGQRRVPSTPSPRQRPAETWSPSASRHERLHELGGFGQLVRVSADAGSRSAGGPEPYGTLRRGFVFGPWRSDPASGVNDLEDFVSESWKRLRAFLGRRGRASRVRAAAYSARRLGAAAPIVVATHRLRSAGARRHQFRSVFGCALTRNSPEVHIALISRRGDVCTGVARRVAGERIPVSGGHDGCRSLCPRRDRWNRGDIMARTGWGNDGWRWA